MATPAYVALDPNKPDGTIQPPDQYSASDLANVRAIRDGIIMGHMPGWSFQSDVSNGMRPTYFMWVAAPLRLFMQLAYTAVGGIQLPTTVQFYWSNDNGSTYSQIGPNVAVTWDAARYQLNAANADAGLWCGWLNAFFQGVLARDAIASHTGASGAAVHGLGTMSTQNANAVNITNGSITANLNNCGISNSALNACYRVYPQPPTTLPTGVAWNWQNGSTQHRIAPGSNIPNITNPAGGEVKRLFVNGAGAITIGSGGGIAFSWAQGHPVWGASATLVTLCAVEANWIIGTTIPF